MYQKTIILGRLGRDAEQKETNGQKYFKLNVAVDNGYKDRATQQWVDRTTWYNVTIWRELKTNRLQKGAIVLVEGELSPRVYSNQSGQAMIDMAMRGDGFKIVVFAQTGENNVVTATQATPVPDNYSPGYDDDLPF